MPNFNLSKPEIDPVATFLLGSVDSNMPGRYYYKPTDARQDIIDGWWVVRKYNCMGCHQVHVGQSTVFMQLPQSGSGLERPASAQPDREGRALDPNWLMRFLKNPALSEKDRTVTASADTCRRACRLSTSPTARSEAGAVLRRAVCAAHALYRAAARGDQRTGTDNGAQPILERGRAVPEVSHDGRSQARCPGNGAQFHYRQRAPEARLDERWIVDPAMMAPALPCRPASSAGGRSLCVRRAHAGEFPGYKKDHANLLVRYMFQFTPEEQGRLRSAPALVPGGKSR